MCTLHTGTRQDVLYSLCRTCKSRHFSHHLSCCSADAAEAVVSGERRTTKTVVFSYSTKALDLLQSPLRTQEYAFRPAFNQTVLFLASFLTNLRQASMHMWGGGYLRRPNCLYMTWT